MTAQTNFEEEKLCVKVYDIETKQLLHVFDNYRKAGSMLNIRHQTVAAKCANKRHVFSSRLNKNVALRLARREEKAV